jgi:hypothetical protein
LSSRDHSMHRDSLKIKAALPTLAEFLEGIPFGKNDDSWRKRYFIEANEDSFINM